MNRLPAVTKHYLTCPVKPSFLRMLAMPPPPPDGTQPPPPNPFAAPPRTSAWGHVAGLFRYASEGWRGVGV